MTTIHTSIASDTTVGPVSLAVADLDRSIRFYVDVLGFTVLNEMAGTATLGTRSCRPLVEIIESKNAQLPPRRSTGLFHQAFLLPSRAALGRSLSHLIEQNWKLTGAGDHLVSEALYLNDPDGNGIELYYDRPRSTWEFTNGRVHMDTLHVDLDSLIEAGKTDFSPWTGVSAETTVGHVHLKVADLEATQRFYVDILGFDLMCTMPQALFVAAGGYHHHIGLNTWMSESAPPPPLGSVGLREFVINMPDRAALDDVVGRLDEAGISFEQHENGVTLLDPSQNCVHLSTRRS